MLKILTTVIIFYISIVISSAQRYFQQHLKYTIYVYLNEKEKNLNGNIKITYYNNSSETLQFIYFHVYPNASKYKKISQLTKQKIHSNDFKLYYSHDSLTGYLDNLDFKVNNKKTYFYLIPDTPDVIKLLLNNPLLPGDSIEIETPFFVKIPYKKIMRMGYDDKIFVITQWYPKPAVYDSSGWHILPYLDYGEYYSEFASYDVTINVPDSFIVAATGWLQNKNELKRLLFIANRKVDYQKEKIFKSNERKILNYKIENVHDFAWFASPFFKVNYDSVELNNKTIYTFAYYLSDYGENILTNYIKESILYYSEIFGDYPYKICSVVETPDFIDGGMEYPTITNIGYFTNSEYAFKVILHEIGHNWLYGILASNERDQPFIDEGLNTFIENNYNNWLKKSRYYYPDDDYTDIFNDTTRLIKSGPIFKSFSPYVLCGDISNYFYYLNLDKPLNSRTEEFNTIHYFAHSYYKGAYAWQMLYQYTGKNDFFKNLKTLYNKYKFKHINHNSFKDVFSTINDSIKWLFNDLLFTTSRSEYKLKQIKLSNNKITGCVINKENTYFPCAIYVNDTLKKIILPASNKFYFEIDSINNIKSLCINQNYDFPEKKYNNNCKIFGIRNKISRININLAGYKQNIGYYDIYFLPIGLYNTASNELIGVLVYSPVFPDPYNNVRIMPLYSFSQKKLEGSLFFSKSLLSKIILEFYAQKYSTRLNNSWYSYNVSLKYNNINLSMLKDNLWTLLYNFNYSTTPLNTSKFSDYSTIRFITMFNKGISCYRISPHLELSFKSNYIKLLLNSSLHLVYNEKKKKLGVDFFYGTFILNKTNIYYYNIFLSGRYGYIDYLYSDYYFDRKFHYSRHNFFSHQFDISEGLFTVFTPIQTNKWLSSLRFWFDLPISIPISFYIATATYYGAGKLIYNSNKFPYEYGFELKFIKDIFAIYFPAGMSNDLKKFSDMYCNSYFEKIRFTLKIRELNVFRHLDKTYKLNKLII